MLAKLTTKKDVKAFTYAKRTRQDHNNKRNKNNKAISTFKVFLLSNQCFIDLSVKTSVKMFFHLYLEVILCLNLGKRIKCQI